MSELANFLSGLTPEQVRSEAERLHLQAQRLYAMADAMDGAGASRSAKPAPTPAASSPPAQRNGRQAQHQPKANKRPAILELIQERPQPPWSPTEVRETLIARGLNLGSMEAQTIRVTMGRMVDRGDLVRAGDGYYTLPGYQPEGMT